MRTWRVLLHTLMASAVTAGLPVRIFGTAAVLFACGTSPAISVMRIGADKPDVRGDPVKFRRPAQESYVGIRGGFFVVRSLDDWHGVWSGGSEQPMPATLDTSSQMLLLAVADAPDTVHVAVSRVLETGDKIHIFVKETKKGDQCVTKPERTPFDAVFAPRIDKPVQFWVETDKGESCGDPPAVTVQCRPQNEQTWTNKLEARAGDTFECEMTADARGKFVVVDRVLTLGEMPGGSTAKIAYTKSAMRGSFTVDIFGTYVIRGEATDDSGRKSSHIATIDVKPPKTKDVLIQLVWTNFDLRDEPDTFPRVRLHAVESASKTNPRECSPENALTEICELRTYSAYAQMKLLQSDRRIPLYVKYVDELIEKGPLPCVHVYYDGQRTAETCDRTHRSPDETWQLGVIDMATGKLGPPLPPEAADAGAPDAAPPPKKPGKK